MGMCADVDFETMAKEPVKTEEKVVVAEKKSAVMTGELKTKEEK